MIMENTNEIWKAIPGYEGIYEASTLGRIRSLDRITIDKNGNNKKIKGRMLKLSLAPRDRYYSVELYKSSKIKKYRVHQLIGEVFLNHKPNGSETVVNHKNNDPLDNRLINLELITQRENCSIDKWRYNYSSKYVGVTWDKARDNKWLSRIQINGINVYLGRFECEDEAGEMYQLALENINLYTGDTKQFREQLKLLQMKK